jgi:hypothetical protein
MRPEKTAMNAATLTTARKSAMPDIVEPSVLKGSE